MRVEPRGRQNAPALFQVRRMGLNPGQGVVGTQTAVDRHWIQPRV